MLILSTVIEITTREILSNSIKKPQKDDDFMYRIVEFNYNVRVNWKILFSLLLSKMAKVERFCFMI